MPTTADGRVFARLMQHISALTTTPVTEIAWPNVAFTPTTRPYLDVTFLPAPQPWQGHGGIRKLAGILQISVVADRESGLATPTELAGQVATHFPAHMRVYDADIAVEIPRHPDVLPALYDGPDVRLPVSIPYQAFI